MGVEDFLVRRPPDSLVERYFDAYGGWSNMSYLRTCMTRIIRDQLGYTFDMYDAEGVLAMDAHVKLMLSTWYNFVDGYINRHQGSFPYSWTVSDNILVLPDKQDNEDFWEMFIDELMLKAKTMKRAYNV